LPLFPGTNLTVTAQLALAAREVGQPLPMTEKSEALPPLIPRFVIVNGVFPELVIERGS
jgi:hypothetical protein